MLSVLQFHRIFSENSSISLRELYKTAKTELYFFFVKVTVKSGHKNMEIMFFTQSFMKEIEEKITKMWLIL